jgi:DNA replication protein DnaC
VRLKQRQEGLLNEEPVDSKPKCPICKGTHWFAKAVPFGHADFGEIYECPCVEDDPEYQLAKVAQMIRFNNFPTGKHPRTLENFRVIKGAEQAHLSAVSFAEGSDPASFLVLNGTNGCGKSHLLEGIGRKMADVGTVVKYEAAEDLLSALKRPMDRSDGPTVDDVERIYRDVAVLLLDELGSVYNTSYGVSKLASIIDWRYRNDMRTVVATHKTIDQTTESLGSMIASRLWDTDTGRTHLVVLTAPDYRTGRRWQ